MNHRGTSTLEMTTPPRSGSATFRSNTSTSSLSAASNASSASPSNKYLPNFFLSKRSEPKKASSGYFNKYPSKDYFAPCGAKESFGNASYEDLVPKDSIFVSGQENEDFGGGSCTASVSNEQQLLDSCFGASASASAGQSDNWVTVFGFPACVAPAILHFFSQIGQIVSQESVPEGNFVNLNFSSPWDSQKALEKNGFLFDGKYMIGVIAVRSCAGNPSSAPTLGISSGQFQYSSPSLTAGYYGIAGAGAGERCTERLQDSPVLLKQQHRQSKNESLVLDEEKILMQKPTLIERVVGYFVG